MKQQKLFNLTPEQRKAANDARPKPNLPTKTNYHPYEITPKDTKTQNKLADELIEWAYNNEVIDLDLFPLSKRLSPYRFYKISQSNPYLEEALEVAKYIISSRLKKGWADRSIDASYAKEMLPEYNQTYRDWVRMKILAVMELRARANDPSNFTVVLDQIPTSSAVPERITDEHQTRNPNKTEQVPTTLIPDTNT